MDIWLILLSGVSFVVLIYFYVQQKFSHWSSRNVPGPKPSLLAFGNLGNVHSRDPYELEQDFRAKYGKFYGNYRGFQPVLAVADADVVKQVMVKDFHLFMDQQPLTCRHKIASRILFLENTPNWKRIRTMTTACFSSAKMRAMFSQMDHSVDQMVANFDRVIRNDKGIVADLKATAVAFTLDVLASNVYGIQTNLLEQSKSDPFLAMAVKVLENPSYKQFGLFTFPTWLNNLVGIRQPFNENSWDYFEKLGREVLRQRKSKESGKRNDLIDLLIKAQIDESELNNMSFDKLDSNFDPQDSANANSNSNTKSSKIILSEEEIIAQAVGFLIGGFESVATALSCTLYELALNPEVQEQLFDELESVLSGTRPNTTKYNDLVMQNNYLDAVMKEGLRMHPPFTRIGRRFAGTPEPYKLGNTGVVLQPNQLVEFPTLALHYDEDYFPEPHRFFPDRFMPENKHNLVPYSFLPFAQGPRNCIGMRFAIQEIKLCLAKVCRQIRFSTTDRTAKPPIKVSPYRLVYSSEKIEVKVERR